MEHKKVTQVHHTNQEDLTVSISKAVEKIFDNFYNEDDMKIFQVRPGIAGLASLKYRNEVELLKAAKNPEEFFIKTIIPDKLRFNKMYIKKQSFFFDLKLILITVVKVITK